MLELGWTLFWLTSRETLFPLRSSRRLLVDLLDVELQSDVKEARERE